MFLLCCGGGGGGLYLARWGRFCSGVVLVVRVVFLCCFGGDVLVVLDPNGFDFCHKPFFVVDRISACRCIETHTGPHIHIYPCGSNPRTCNNATTVSHNTLPAHSHKQPSDSFLHMLLWQNIFTAFGVSRFGWNQKCNMYGANLHQLYTTMFQIPVARILSSEAKFSFVLREARGSPGCVGSHGVLGRAPPDGLGREKRVKSAAN